jgi:hypothetical protein
MPRVTDPEVRILIPNTEIDDLTPFITAASLVVDKIAAGCASDLSTAQLKEVERWLSAHFAALSDDTLNITEEEFEDARTKYNKASGSANAGNQGVLTTSYGQTANTLACGCLAEVDMITARSCFA